MTTRTTPLVQARRVDDLLDPPPIIAELMEGEPALADHLALAGRYRELVERTVELARSLEGVRREDDDRRRAALAGGRRPSEAKAPKVEAALAQARRDVELLDAAVRDSMTRLATAALPFVDEAAGELERRRDACEQRLRDLFAACEAAIGEHSALGAEGLWVGQLRLAGHVTAYRPGARVAALRRTAEEIRRLSLGLDEDLHRQGEIAEAREREAEVDARMPLPPGTVVWQPGQPDKVVTEDGVEEIER